MPMPKNPVAGAIGSIPRLRGQKSPAFQDPHRGFDGALGQTGSISDVAETCGYGTPA
jgi:hypothetical protein